MSGGKYKLHKRVKQFEKDHATEAYRVPGRLGVKIGGKTLIEVPNRKGYVYVRLRGDLSELIQAYNSIVANIYDLPVICVRSEIDQGKWYIEGRDISAYSDWGNSSYLPDHGAQHSFDPDTPGRDLVWVWNRQFMPLNAVPNSGSVGANNLLIEEGMYYRNNTPQFFPATLTADILSSRPATDQAKMVLVYLDTANTIQLLAGSEFSANLTGTADAISNLPTFPADLSIPIAGVLLASGTSILSWDNTYDLRPFFRDGSGVGSSGSSGHDSVTLDSNADNVLSLSGQELGLKNQSANTVLAGPSSGTSDIPEFRGLVATDLGSGTPDGSKFLRDDRVWAIPPGTPGSGITWQRTVVVDQAGNGNYTSIADAITFVGSQTRNITHQWVILLTNGYYGPNYPSFTIPTYTHVMSFNMALGNAVSGVVWLDMEDKTSGYTIIIPEYSSLDGVYVDVAADTLTGDHGAISLTADVLYNSINDVQIKYQVSDPASYKATAIRDSCSTASLSYLTNIRIVTSHYGLYSDKASSWFGCYRLLIDSSSTAVYLKGTMELYGGSYLNGLVKSVDGTGTLRFYGAGGLGSFADAAVDEQYYGGGDARAIQDIPIERVTPNDGDILQYDDDDYLWKFIPLPTGSSGGGDMYKSTYDPDDDGKIAWGDVDDKPTYYPALHATTADYVISVDGEENLPAGFFLQTNGGGTSTWVSGTSSIGASGVTFENLSANGDIGSGADQVPAGNHTHGSSGTKQAVFYIAGAIAVAQSPFRIVNHTGGTVTLSGVYLDIDTAPTGAAAIVDVHKIHSGSEATIFTNQAHRPQIADGAYSGNSTTLDVTTWEDGDILKVSVDQKGSTVAGSDLTITVVYS